MLTLVTYVQNFISQRLRRDDRGVTAVEYGLLVFLIALVIVGVVITLGKNLSSVFDKVASDI